MPITLTVFRSGAITHWPMQGKPSRAMFGASTRGGIHDLSTKSRIRCAWQLSNSPQDWGAMCVLTFRSQPTHPKVALKKFVRAFTAASGGREQWAWVMEWQRRGVIHFHLFFSANFIERVGYWTETVKRHGTTTELIRGSLDEWIQAEWIKAVGDCHPDFIRFQAGGIVERLRSPDAAGRYVAKEAGKRTQKQLPDGVEAAGRWWWLSPAGKPKATRTITMERWPYEKAYHHVFDVDQCLRKKVSVARRCFGDPETLENCRVVTIRRPNQPASNTHATVSRAPCLAGEPLSSCPP